LLACVTASDWKDGTGGEVRSCDVGKQLIWVQGSGLPVQLAARPADCRRM
jgi:hypothetical protein